MKNMKMFVVLIAFWGLNMSSAVAKTYPQNGVIGHVSFNQSMKDNTGNITFTSKDCVPVWVEGEDGKANTAQRFNSESDGDKSCSSRYSIKNLTGNIETFVWTFKLDDVRNHSFSTVSPYGFGIENGKITYNAPRDSTSSKDVTYRFDIELKNNQWITLVSTWDYAKHTVTFYANGKKQVINNPSIKLSSRNSNTKTGRKDGGISSYPIDIDEFYLYNRALTEKELIALCGVEGKIEAVEKNLKRKHGYETTVWRIPASSRKNLSDTTQSAPFSIFSAFKPSVIKEAYKNNKAKTMQKMDEEGKSHSRFKNFAQQFKNYFSEDNSLTEIETVAILVPWVLALFLFLCYLSAKIFKRVDEVDAYSSVTDKTKLPPAP